MTGEAAGLAAGLAAGDSAVVPADVTSGTQTVAAGPSGEAAFRREIGGRIRAERSLRNLRQEELARRAGVSRNFVSAIERGTQRLDAWRLVHLARALDCDLCRLLDGSRPAPRPGAGRDETAR